MSSHSDLEETQEIKKNWRFSGDQIYKAFLRFVGITVLFFLGVMALLLVFASMPAIKEFGFHFIISDAWNPVLEEYGALPFVYGTFVTSILALVISAPFSVMVALFITEVLPSWASKVVGIFVEMIAAVPSIVFGLWGLFFLAPWIRTDLSPFLKETLGFLPFFQGPSFGIGFLAAGLILSIMITPTIASLSREVFTSVPKHNKEAALALGATRQEMVHLAVLKPSFSGITGAIVLGFGRALGETMAVAMVIGNSARISESIFSPGATMASVMANEYAEASSDMHVAALSFIGLVLFVITLLINASARAIIWKFSPIKKGQRREKK